MYYCIFSFFFGKELLFLFIFLLINSWLCLAYQYLKCKENIRYVFVIDETY